MTSPSRVLQTTYLDGEGRKVLSECLRCSFEWAAEQSVAKIIMFTATGEGPILAARTLLQKHPAVSVVAVTPPVGRPYADPDHAGRLVGAGITGERRQFLTEMGVPIVAAQLPFKEVHTGKGDERRSEWSRVAEAFGVLGGGFALAVQAVLLATDAGEAAAGERVIAMTADTALSVRAARTETFLSPVEGLIVEHIICRPGRYDISKPRHVLFRAAPPQLELPEAALPRLPDKA